MVENSLGRMWDEARPDNHIKSQWRYYIEDSEQKKSVLDSINKLEKVASPEDLKCIDTCMGSGHILCVLFDVLVQIYEDYGYSVRDAVANIVEKNIWGLDIDTRAAQLSYFTVMMKARQYDRRFFSRSIQPNVYSVEESNGIEYQKEYVESLMGDTQQGTLKYLLDVFKDAKEYGAILKVEKRDYKTFIEEWKKAAENCNDNLGIYSWYKETSEKVMALAQQALVLSQKYDVVVTNPPYMSNRNIGKKTANYIQQNYKECKNDMFAVFIDVASQLTKKSGFYAMITQPSIITLSAFKKLRYRMIHEQSFVSLIHMGRGIFGVDFGSTAFVLRNTHIDGFTSNFFKLFERTFQYIDPDDIEQIFLNAKSNQSYRFDFAGYNKKAEEIDDAEMDGENIEVIPGKIQYCVDQKEFLNIPDNPFAYWMAPELIEAFEKKRVEDYSTVTNGLFTCDNNRFLRLWHEIDFLNFNRECSCEEENRMDTRRWYPYNKGGNYRKWYGNHEYVVDFRDFGKDISEYRVASGQSASFPGHDYYFKPSLSWSFISAAKFGIRYYPMGFVFDIAGSSVFVNDEEKLYQLLAFLGSEVVVYALQIINPTMNYQAGNVKQLPLYDEVFQNQDIGRFAKENVMISKADWDSYETSWNFKRNPLCSKMCNRIKEAYNEWEKETTDRFLTVKENERQINDILIKIYHLEDYVKPDVGDKYITIQLADKEKNVKEFISYAIGCMFGRYSLDIDGIAYAGGEWDESKYMAFIPDVDAIIPICDDEYFEDDIVGRFTQFVETVYGKDTLEENLQFIADALGGKGSAREVIRNYFINDFYSDHIKTYQKRPIYWLFDSGKKNGFKCLVYMHRYQPDTIARIRTDYVHEQQARYRTAIEEISNRIESSSGSDKVKLTKKLNTLKAQNDEIHAYEEKIHHLADQMISIDLDDGVKKNYEIFKDVLAKIK